MEVRYTDEQLYAQDERAWDEMMSDLFHKAVNSLDKTEKYILRHAHELREGFAGQNTYEKRDCKDMATVIGITPSQVRQLRLNAISKIWQFMFKPEIADISKIKATLDKFLPLK